MDADETSAEIDELILWAGCIAKAVRFSADAHARFKAGDPAAIDLLAGGLIGFAQTAEHLDAARRIGYERRLSSFAARVGANLPILDVGDLLGDMSRASSRSDALLARAAAGSRILLLDRSERRFLLQEYDRFSDAERPAFLRIATATLEELRDAFLRVGDRLPGLSKTIIALEKLIRDERGEEPGGNVREPLPDVPPPRGPLVGRAPRPAWEDDSPTEVHPSGARRHLLASGVSGTAA